MLWVPAPIVIGVSEAKPVVSCHVTLTSSQIAAYMQESRCIQRYVQVQSQLSCRALDVCVGIVTGITDWIWPLLALVDAVALIDDPCTAVPNSIACACLHCCTSYITSPMCSEGPKALQARGQNLLPRKMTSWRRRIVEFCNG